MADSGYELPSLTAGAFKIPLAGAGGTIDPAFVAAAAPAAHKTSHQDGGTDEISVAGLSGLLADPQTPLTHSMASHTDEGALATLNTVGATQIDDGAVTYPKLADTLQYRVTGRVAAGSGAQSALTPANLATVLAQTNIDQGSNTANAGAFKVGGTQVVGAQATAVADASGGVVIDAEARTALNALLARLRTHGLVAI